MMLYISNISLIFLLQVSQTVQDLSEIHAAPQFQCRRAPIAEYVMLLMHTTNGLLLTITCDAMHEVAEYNWSIVTEDREGIKVQMKPQALFPARNKREILHPCDVVPLLPDVLSDLVPVFQLEAFLHASCPVGRQLASCTRLRDCIRMWFDPRGTLMCGNSWFCI
jgi:hypothetical protein